MQPSGVQLHIAVRRRCSSLSLKFAAPGRLCVRTAGTLEVQTCVRRRICSDDSQALETELARLKTLVADGPLSTSQAPLPPHEQAGSEPSASRRDLLRYGAVALGAAAVAGMAASPVEAADGGPVLISSAQHRHQRHVSEFVNGRFRFLCDGIRLGLRTARRVVRNRHLRGHHLDQRTTLAFKGSLPHASGQTPGVYGLATSATAPAVYGRHPNGGNAVRAEVPAVSSFNAIAMYALNYSTYTAAGRGPADSRSMVSRQRHGLVGATAAAGAAAVVGATNGVAGAYAAAFYGPVIVGGDFTVVGGAKSAAVPHPDGSHRRLYCVESPESWFEDFGRGTLVCGEAVVPLDRDFAAVVDATEYHVFLTGHDGRFDLSVSDQTADGFRYARATAPKAPSPGGSLRGGRTLPAPDSRPSRSRRNRRRRTSRPRRTSRCRRRRRFHAGAWHRGGRMESRSPLEAREVRGGS